MSPTLRDRTQEFFATVQVYTEQQPSKKHHPSLKSSNSNVIKLPTKSVEQSSRIRHLADNIAESIENVEYKIIELKECAKLTSNFRDERPQIQSLILSIKQDTDKLNNNLSTLQLAIKQSFKELPSSHSCVKHNKTLLDILQIRYKHLAKSFQSAMQVSTKHLQRQKKEREKMDGGTRKISRRSVPMNRLKRRNRNGPSTETESLLSDSSQSNNNFSGQQSAQVQLYQESNYNEQRAMEAEHIESQLTEISHMMGKLANMVDDQRHTILQIGDNVDESVVHMEGAIEQLQKYLASLSGNRWLMIKVFALLIFLAIVFTLFIA